MAAASSSSSSTPAQPQQQGQDQQQVVKDCLGCRVTGTAAFTLVAAYLANEYRQMPPGHRARPFVATLGAGMSGASLRA